MITAIVYQYAMGTDAYRRVGQRMVLPAANMVWGRVITTDHPRQPWKSLGVIHTDTFAPAAGHQTAVPRVGIMEITDDEFVALRDGTLERNVALRFQRALDAMDATLIGKGARVDIPATDDAVYASEAEKVANAIIDGRNDKFAPFILPGATARGAGPHRDAAYLATHFGIGPKVGAEAPAGLTVADPAPYSEAVAVAEAPAPKVKADGSPVTFAKVKAGQVLTRPNGEQYRAIPVDIGHKTCDIQMYRDAHAAGEHIFLYGPPGTGKGHPLSTNVLTPEGWATVGSLIPGDAVIGSNGEATTVLDVYDRGVLPTYRVTFSDGSSVVVDGDHLWNVQTSKQRRTHGRWETRETRSLIGDLTTSDRRYKWHIPMVAPVQHPHRELPIPAYTLGCMLANGHLHGGVMSFHAVDSDVWERIAAETPITENHTPLASVRRFYVDRWIAENKWELIGHDRSAKSADKFIPAEYLTAHISDRIALLNGLMDCDGSVRKDETRSSAKYHTTSARLAEGVRALVESLGGTARIISRKRDAYTEYTVLIMLDFNPFSSRRKGMLWGPSTRYTKRAMVSIVPVGDEEVRCIRVAAEDSLYVTERYIVTHNTASLEVAFPGLHTLIGSKDVELPDLIGTWIPVVDAEGRETFTWMDGPLLRAMEEGVPLFIDEIALIPSPVLSVVYGVMDGRDEIEVTSNPARGTVKAAPGFTVVAATNPDAPGAVLSEALLSRFGLKAEVHTDFDAMLALGVDEKMVNLAKNLHKQFLNGEAAYVPQARELLRFQRDVARVTEVYALRNFLNAVPEEEREIIQDKVRESWGALPKADKLLIPLRIGGNV